MRYISFYGPTTQPASDNPHRRNEVTQPKKNAHPEGITWERELVTPEMATEWLENGNTRNRTVSPKTVDQYTRDMVGGRWKFVVDAIRFDRDGVLLDGQHRLLAIRKSNTTQEFLVVRGLAPETQAVIDGGRRRNANDYASIEKIPNYTTVTGIASLAIRWDVEDLVSPNLKLSVPEVTEYIAANLDDLAWASAIAIKVTAQIPARRPIIGAVALRAKEVSSLEMTEEFFEKLASGLELVSGDPVTALRGTLIRAKNPQSSSRLRYETMPRLVELYYVVRAWNLRIKGVATTKMVLPHGGVTTEQQIQLIGTKD
jgi:hypothetical protein